MTIFVLCEGYLKVYAFILNAHILTALIIRYWAQRGKIATPAAASILDRLAPISVAHFLKLDADSAEQVLIQAGIPKNSIKSTLSKLAEAQ